MPRLTPPPWRRDQLQARLPKLRTRSAVLRRWRRWFADNGFDEVETPALQTAPGAEVHLQAFWTDYVLGEERRSYGLHTSPEFAMKTLLAGGLERIFQFAPVFRNGERSATHHPAFTMLEWYRAGDGTQGRTDVLIEDCEALFAAAASVAATQGRDGLLRWSGMTADPSKPFERLSVSDAFERYAGLDLTALIDVPEDPDPRPIREAAASMGLYVAEDDRFDDAFFRIFLERIEPNLGQGRVTALTDYPICMAALSRPRSSDPRWADRFELYAAGLELANAFGELVDPVEQRRRFERDLAAKRTLYGEDWPMDEGLLAALDPMRDGGLPDTAGIALGFDRLVMLLTGAETIEQVLWSPVPEGTEVS